MTHDLAWAERVKSEYKELLGRISRLGTFLQSKPSIDKEDILLLETQLDIMRSYVRILITRLQRHNIEIDEEYLKR